MRIIKLNDFVDAVSFCPLRDGLCDKDCPYLKYSKPPACREILLHDIRKVIADYDRMINDVNCFDLVDQKTGRVFSEKEKRDYISKHPETLKMLISGDTFDDVEPKNEAQPMLPGMEADV